MLHAAAAILIRDSGHLLISKRPTGKIMEGYWEFPGGKLEAGETPEQALVRELQEELGITLETFSPFTFLSEARAEYHVIVYVYICTHWRGEPVAREQQEFAWVLPEQLSDYELLPANRLLIPALHNYFSILKLAEGDSINC